MKILRSIFFLGIVLSINLFVWGIIVSKGLFDLVSKFDITFFERGFWEWQSAYILFCLAISLTPILLIATWKIGSITSPKKRIASILVVFMFMVLGVFVRRQILKTYFVQQSKITTNKIRSGYIMYPYNELNFERYIFTGTCFGCIISYFLFRRREH